MTANVTDPPFFTSSGMKYPANRNDPFFCADLWLQDKRNDDGAEGLWRIHDDLYDLSNWINKHPGGKMWIELTKGTDITEAFESYHVSLLPEKLLPRFYVRKASSPRNSPFTFKDDGFHRNMKRKIRTVLNSIPENVANKSKSIADCLLLSFVLTAILSAILNSFLVGIASGLLLGLTTVAAHNFFHQKDNYRMYYFDFSFMSSREWRISHALSHHLFTNTINDMEISLLEPFLFYLPASKTTLRGILSCIISPGVYASLFISMFIKRMLGLIFGKNKSVCAADILPFLILALMYVMGDRTVFETIGLWLWIVAVGSFYFAFVGVNAAHHHPEIFHDGDAMREDRDWGLAQLDTVMDRREVTGSLFLVLTHFGDHTIHHLFPTIDHSKLPYLYPALKETCEEFSVKFRMTSQLNLILGQFWQLVRTTTNPFPPGVKWNWYADAKHKILTLDFKKDV